MNDVTAQQAGQAIRASDTEREQIVALLQRNFADGRLTQAELEERAGAAYAAHTRAQLRDLTIDLPAAQEQRPRPCVVLDLRLLCILLCVCPPAGLVYWLLSLRNQPVTTCPQPATSDAERSAMMTLAAASSVDHSSGQASRL